MIENIYEPYKDFLVLGAFLADVIEDQIESGGIIGEELRRLAELSCIPGTNTFVVTGLRSAMDQVNRNFKFVEEVMEDTGIVSFYNSFANSCNEINTPRERMVGLLACIEDVHFEAGVIDLTEKPRHLQLVTDNS